MYFLTISRQFGPARADVSVSSPSASAKMRTSAETLPFAVSAPAYWPSPGESERTSLVTRPVTSSAARGPPKRMRTRSPRSISNAPERIAAYSLASDILGIKPGLLGNATGASVLCHCVGCIEQINRMYSAGFGSIPHETGADLHVAPRIACRNKLSTRLGDVGELSRQNSIRRFGLDEIVDPGCPAALVGIPQRH